MSSRQFIGAFVAITLIVTMYLGSVGSQTASVPMVSQQLAQKARSDGQVRVIVELATSATARATIDSDIIADIRRAEVARARGTVRGSLQGTKHRVVREYHHLPFIAVEVGPDGLQTLESLQGLVVRVMEDGLNRPFLGQSTGVVQADEVWAGGFGGTPFTGAGTVIAILDTGVDKNHPFLAGKVVEEACFSSTDGGTSLCPGGVTESFAPDSGMPCNVPNVCEHGTHVAGIAAGTGSSFSGVAKGAQIMAVQVFTRFENCFPRPSPCIGAWDSDVLAGLERVYERRSAHNFAAVNMSLGGDKFTSHCDTDIRKRIIDLLRSAGIATVIASGNEGHTDGIASPACISSAVSVGSTGDGSGGATLDEVSDFSNSAFFLSLLAPGSRINSAVPGNGFAVFDGTSMAAPHVAGAFALLKEAGTNLTVSQMLDALQNTGVDVTDSRNNITKPRIQILDALFDLPLGDVTPPEKVADLKAGSVTQTTVSLNWTAPGDDGDVGEAAVYDIRHASTKFTDTNWGTLTQAGGEPSPDPAGAAQSATIGNLLCGRSYFFALKTRDEAGNESPLSNVARARTAACNKLAVSPTRLPGAEQGVAYDSGAINISNGAPPYDLQILTNTSPDISYDASSKSFKGTPSAAGSFKVSGIAKDSVGSERKVSFAGKITPPVQIATKALKAGKVNVPYKATFRAKGGMKPYDWEIIPSGLSLADFELDPKSGKATVLATLPGTVDLNVKVKSLTGGTASQSFKLEFK